ncbi:unnamed protein product [Musa textilis]
MVARVSKSWELKTYAVKPQPMAFPRESRLRNRTTTTLWCALREGSDVGENFLLMLQPLVDQMAIPCFPGHARVVAIVLSLLLLLFSCWSCCCNHLASAFLTTLFVLVLSTSLPFSLPRIRQLVKSDSIQKPSPADQVFADKTVDAAVAGSGEGELTHTWTSSDSGTQDSLSRSASQFSNFDDDDESLPEDACHSTDSSEDSISDDENLIEISLPDGHFVAPEKPKALLKPLPHTRRGFLTNLLPDSVLRQHGLMELLSDINEEDNLIEIDITKGSIKYSREGIKA